MNAGLKAPLVHCSAAAPEHRDGRLHLQKAGCLQVCLEWDPASWAWGMLLSRMCRPLPHEQRGTFLLGFHGPSICSTNLRHCVEPLWEYNEGQDLFSSAFIGTYHEAGKNRLKQMPLQVIAAVTNVVQKWSAAIPEVSAPLTKHISQKSDYSSDCQLLDPRVVSQPSPQLPFPLPLGPNHILPPCQFPLLGAL